MCICICVYVYIYIYIYIILIAPIRYVPGGTKRETSVSMPLLRLQSSEGKFTMYDVHGSQSQELDQVLTKRIEREGTKPKLVTSITKQAKR